MPFLCNGDEFYFLCGRISDSCIIYVTVKEYIVAYYPKICAYFLFIALLYSFQEAVC